MKTGICQICKEAFKLTKGGKLYRHGYKQELHIKKWKSLFGIFERRYFKLTQDPCSGTGQLPLRMEK